MEPNLEPNDSASDALPDIPGVSDWLIALASGAPEAMLSGHPLVTLMGPMLVPLFQTARALDMRSFALGALRSGRALQVAAETAEMTVEELAGAIEESPARTELSYRVLEAAARTVDLDGKVEALGRTLVLGLDDDAKLDEAVLLVAALRDCEKPHVRVLAEIERQPQSPHMSPAPITGAMGWTQEQLVTEFPEYRPVMSHLVSTMARHVLIRDISYGGGGSYGGGSGGAGGPSRWLIDSLGAQLLQLLREAAPNS